MVISATIGIALLVIAWGYDGGRLSGAALSTCVASLIRPLRPSWALRHASASAPPLHGRRLSASSRAIASTSSHVMLAPHCTFATNEKSSPRCASAPVGDPGKLSQQRADT